MAEPAKTSRPRRRSAATKNADVVALPDAGRAEPAKDADVVPLAERESLSTPRNDATAEGAESVDPPESVVEPFPAADAADDEGADDVDAAASDEPSGTSDVARSLRGAREARGISLVQAAESTCIAASYLRALEDDEPVSSFPAPAYARFFAREYAQYLGLDGEEIVDRFVEHHGIVDEAVLSDAPPDLSARSPWTFRALAAASIAVLVVLAAFAIGRSASPGSAILPLPTGAQTGASDASTANESGAVDGGAQVGARPQRIRAEFRVVEDSWVAATADGESVFTGRVVASGHSPILLQAKRFLSVRLGNPRGVRLVVNGERTAIEGAPTVPVTVRLVLRHGRIVQRTA
jgi:Helix-turn-helix domain/Domain of unknown function (DUF4115)